MPFSTTIVSTSPLSGPRRVRRHSLRSIPSACASKARIGPPWRTQSTRPSGCASAICVDRRDHAIAHGRMRLAVVPAVAAQHVPREAVGEALLDLAGRQSRPLADVDLPQPGILDHLELRCFAIDDLAVS